MIRTAGQSCPSAFTSTISCRTKRTFRITSLPIGKRRSGPQPHLNKEGLAGSALFYDHQIMMPERLVMENIISARRAGAVLLNYHRVEKIEEQGHITVTARDVLSGGTKISAAKVLVNASGPWIDTVRRAGNINETKDHPSDKGHPSGAAQTVRSGAVRDLAGR